MKPARAWTVWPICANGRGARNRGREIWANGLSGESFPAARHPLSRTDPTQNPNKFTAKPLQHRSVGASQDELPQHNPHTSGHKQHRFPHPGRVPEEYVSEDLAEIVANWDSLSDAPKADTLAKVREAIGD